MRIAIIEHRYREYLMDALVAHPEFAGEIVCFVEENPQRSIVQQIPVISFSELKQQDFDTVLIAESRNQHLSQYLTWLHDENIKNIYIIRLFALDTHADFISGSGFNMTCVDHIPNDETKAYLVHLETHVCDQCNLNCKACNNFSPFVNEPVCTDIGQFKIDISKLAVSFRIGRFFLLGGEPLLEPERCCEMVEVFREYFPTTELRLLTNATLIPRMKETFWECLRKNRVLVHISVYPPVVEKLEEIETVLQNNGIQYILAKRIEKFAKHWTLYPFEDEEFNNQKCGSAGCHYLRDGFLAKCPDEVLAGYMAAALDCTPEAIRKEEKIRISSIDDAWSVIRQLNAPCEMCKRCTFQRIEYRLWEPAKKPANPADWLLENRLEHEIRQLKKTIKEQEARETKLQEEIKDCRFKFKQASESLKATENCLSILNGDYDAMKHSLSFRLGRFLTWPLRKTRDAILNLNG